MVNKCLQIIITVGRGFGEGKTKEKERAERKGECRANVEVIIHINLLNAY